MQNNLHHHRQQNGQISKDKFTEEYTADRKKNIIHLGKGFNYDEQSVQFKDNPVERISKLLENTRTLKSYLYEEIQTMNDVLENGQRLTKSGICIGQMNTLTNAIDWYSYNEVNKRIKHIADGLMKKFDLKPKNSYLGLYSINCVEYTLIEYACYRHSIIIVPIYDTLGANVASFVANQTELTIIACDNYDRLQRILKLSEKFQYLKYIIWMKNNEDITDLKKEASEKGFQLFKLNEIEMIGEKNPIDDNKPDRNDLAIICYTSGTTDIPKGVMLTHENIIASVVSCTVHLIDQAINADDVMISILPLAHMFQRLGDALVFSAGGKVVYYSGDIRQLAAEISIIKPTIMCAVPRLLNRIYDAIYSKANQNSLKLSLLNLAYRQKYKDLVKHIIVTNTIWDRLIFNRIRLLMGSRLRIICVGSAPSSSNVLDFLRVALGCVISEGYGQTECVGPCTATLVGDETTGHVGPPLVGAMVKLIDVPEMNYYVNGSDINNKNCNNNNNNNSSNSNDGNKNENKKINGCGEILVKGPIVFKGYHKMKEKTDETLDKDGWLHTGDIGYWKSNGTLCLIDRRKNIFKLSQGEYIAPEKIENILINSRMIQQIFIYGDSFQSKLIAIVVPDWNFIQLLSSKFLPENLENMTEQQLNNIDNSSLRKNQLKKLILDDLNELGRRYELKSFELPKNIYLRKNPMTIEEGLLTPTMKSKRNAIARYYENEIKSLYKELESNDRIE